MTPPNQRERQFLQQLQDAGWVKVGSLPQFPGTIQTLLRKGWIKQSGVGYGLRYGITDKGLAAKAMPVRVYK